jgi:signal transduction histidine kinase
VQADGRLLQVVFDNLFDNAWKFTRKTADARIEFGREGSTFFVRDNGAGFNMTYVEKLFRPFSRLHKDTDFPGTGIGLATVHRVVARHGGRVLAQGTPGGGATIGFSLPARKSWAER